MSEYKLTPTAHLRDTGTAPSSASLIHKDASAQRPYLHRVEQLQTAYPALKNFLPRASSYDKATSVLIEQLYQKQFGRPPGRCALLTFHENHVEHQEFLQTSQLESYLPTCTTQPGCRLWILEDLQLDWVDMLGGHLGVDPRVFREQMNTYHYTDSNTIPDRALPSMIKPHQSFTLRYYEIRRLQNPKAISHTTNQMTCAVNRRRYERWRDIDTSTMENQPRYRHGFVRRCASFWTKQRPDSEGWDAVLLVDPAFEALPWRDPKGGPSSNLTSSTHSPCTIFQDPTVYESLGAIFKARAWEKGEEQFAPPTMDTSVPYHDGSTTLADVSLDTAEGLSVADVLQSCKNRSYSSPLDEIVFHWMHLADSTMIEAVRCSSVESAQFLLKYVGNQWTNLLELIACGVAESEFFADDHKASVDTDPGAQTWKRKLEGITGVTQDVNYQKRQLSNFLTAMNLNLERLGLIMGAETVNPNQAAALRDAQMDFLNFRNRLQPFADRISGLSNVANDLANLHTAFQGIRDSEFSLRLSFFASVVFPMTLVAALLSMGGDFSPGQPLFWVFWAVSIPLVLVFVVLLSFGRYPENWIREHWMDRDVRHRRDCKSSKHMS